ncbi:MAG: DUF2336 domain-containing protein, partial [Alphaproteobacteria bacterium]
RHDLDPTQIDDIIDSAVGAAVRADGEQNPGGAAASQLATRMLEQQGMSAELLIEVLRTGEVALFEHLIEEATGLRQPLVRRLVYEAGGEGLAILCRAQSFLVEDFTTLLELCRAARPERGEFYPIARVAPETFYPLIRPAAARQVLDRWRRNPDYLDLLRQVAALTISPAKRA